MSFIDIKNLSFTYENSYTPVFENLNLRLDTDWKCALVGRNGRGKTTLLRLLNGELSHGGAITSCVRFSYFPYPVENETRLALEVVQAARPEAEDWKIMRELNALSMDAELLYRPFENLSGGERTRLLLAALFAEENDFLLIDEPTNHLDLEARKAVTQYLNGKKGFLLVSHDRALLDGCVDHVVSLEKDGAEVRSGNFSDWFEAYEIKRAAAEAKLNRIGKEMEKLELSARRTAEWANKAESAKYGKNSSGLRPDKGFVGHRAAKVMKRATVTKARRENEAEEKRALLKSAETDEKLAFSPLVFRAERLIALGDVSISYGNRTVCSHIRLDILRGDRIALDGKNGCGKSSLLKLIAGENIEHTGIFNPASGLIVSYVPQIASVSGRLSDFIKESGANERLFKSILAKMGFRGSDFESELSACSEGQKKKVLLAKSLCERAHLYVWDEPLNFLDIFARIRLEELIKEFQPTMIFVEHDRAFRNNVANKIYKFV